MNFRVGVGKDSHRFASDSELQKCPEKKLIIGGVVFDKHTPFFSHSDGDVLYHAVFNAISSALGKQSIGHFFPNTDDREKERNSAEYLEHVYALLCSEKYCLGNVSIVVECKTPKIDPAVQEIKENLARILHVEKDCIGITSTSGELLSPWGKGLGVEVMCSVLLLR